ncbi:MAG: DMT family transporter [Fimbriimonadaceae bacterium]
MRYAEAAALLGIAALWGGSFVFQRVLAPVYGPVPLTFFRLGFAGLFLIGFALVRRQPVVQWPRIGQLALLAVVSAAAPYTLFAFGAKTLSSAVLSVLNATAPMFGAVFAAVWLAERLSPWQIAGLFLGGAGVVVSSRAWESGLPPGSLLAVGACLLAAACYGLYGIGVQRSRSRFTPLELATASQAIGAVLLLAPTAATGPRFLLDRNLALAAAFGVLCSGVPFLIYTWLLGRLGATRALTVTFLIPVFGSLWGFLLLGERLAIAHWAGGALILLGTYYVTRRERDPVAEPVT